VQPQGSRASPRERPWLEFYGDRAGTLRDPFGHQWTLATHVEDVSPEEMERRARERAERVG
jgi:PhnB protein